MSDTLMPNPNRDTPQVYQIKIEGHLGRMWASWFEQMTITQDDDGNTLLTGFVTDQAVLYGILRQIRDLGMPLIAVTRLPADDSNSGT